jgi:alkylhydroperoxidase family enzyme
MTDDPAPRIDPLEPPYPEQVGETLRRMMPPDVEPLRLFRTVAWNHPVLERFRQIGAYLLNFGKLEPIEREIVLHRTCARCGCAYEWGVHAAVFARQVGLSEAQLEATAVVTRVTRPGRRPKRCSSDWRTSCTTPRRSRRASGRSWPAIGTRRS